MNPYDIYMRHKGIDTFLNEKIMYSILSDLMPRNTKEINWVIDAINSGAVKPLIEAEKNNFIRKSISKKLEEFLKVMR